MTEQAKKYLVDILSAIEKIESFVEPVRSFNEYQHDLKTQSAVERQLAIMGEAVNKFDRQFPDHPIKQAGKIISVRNRLIHAYDNIDNSIIWAIVQNHIKALKQEIRDKLND
jgi:uncharacterized protein with HEPN domain